MKKIFVINGPNLNLLGQREPEKYGNKDLEQINADLKNKFSAIKINFLQSNAENEIVNFIHDAAKSADGIIINAGAYSHTSIAIADAIGGIKIPTVSVHITNIYERESFRQTDLVGDKCFGSIVGLGVEGYSLAIDCLLDEIK